MPTYNICNTYEFFCPWQNNGLGVYTQFVQVTHVLSPDSKVAARKQWASTCVCCFSVPRYSRCRLMLWRRTDRLSLARPRWNTVSNPSLPSQQQGLSGGITLLFCIINSDLLCMPYRVCMLYMVCMTITVCKLRCAIIYFSVIGRKTVISSASSVAYDAFFRKTWP